MQNQFNIPEKLVAAKGCKLFRQVVLQIRSMIRITILIKVAYLNRMNKFLSMANILSCQSVVNSVVTSLVPPSLTPIHVHNNLLKA